MGSAQGLRVAYPNGAPRDVDVAVLAVEVLSRLARDGELPPAIITPTAELAATVERLWPMVEVLAGRTVPHYFTLGAGLALASGDAKVILDAAGETVGIWAEAVVVPAGSPLLTRTRSTIVEEGRRTAGPGLFGYLGEEERPVGVVVGRTADTRRTGRNVRGLELEGTDDGERAGLGWSLLGTWAKRRALCVIEGDLARLFEFDVSGAPFAALETRCHTHDRAGEPGAVPTVVLLDAAAWWAREERPLLALEAGRCGRCGSVEFPRPARACPRCGGDLSPETLPWIGEILTHTRDNLYDADPTPIAVLALPHGGRFYGQVEFGTHDDAIAIGEPAHLVPRMLYRRPNHGVVYFWKIAQGLPL
jgi:uncharacterized OB-fold protein